ncbi:MAG TPA: helix-turn-helix transcriptional regulator [Verrucomicrobiae bacterium]|nr:helix-turn-helix transcriptional regulator [Verrucomicrobiae bacterium]
MTLGQTIAAARKQREWTQKDLATRTLKEDGIAISPQYLNDIERDRREPSAYVLDQLARELDLNPDSLHFLVGQVPPDIVRGDASRDRVAAAVKAFRRTYQSHAPR